jgi:hypothetical protein
LAAAANRLIFVDRLALGTCRPVTEVVTYGAPSAYDRTTSWRRFRRPYFVSIAVLGLVGALGDKDKVSHAFQPDGRLWPSNSPYAFRFM